MSDKSHEYYAELLKHSEDMAKSLRTQLDGVVYETFLRPPDEVDLLCYQKMYAENHGKSRVVAREGIQVKIPGLAAICQKCMPFFLEQRSDLSKSQDVTTGVRFEEPFREFLKSLHIDAFDAGTVDTRLPDIGIKNEKQDVAVLLEIKYHNAPFIKARQFVSPDTECYDGSLTIDVEKCRKEIEVARKLYPNAENLIAHWIDFPCLKCVLWDKLETALGEIVYERRHRPGDYEGGYKVGYTEKTYHFIRKIHDFDSLISTIQTLAGKA